MACQKWSNNLEQKIQMVPRGTWEQIITTLPESWAYMEALGLVGSPPEPSRPGACPGPCLVQDRVQAQVFLL